jgi:ACS family glucarate transporter-like MFS transporter
MTTPKTSVALDAEPRQDAAEASLQYSSQRWWLLLLLFTAMLVSYAHRGALSVAVASSKMSEDLHLSKAGIGILLSSFSWVYAFMQMPSGWLVDRFGVRRADSIGFVFWSLMSASA